MTPAITHAEDAWQFSGTFYLWGAETSTTITTPAGSIGATLSFSDALENLDFAFMGSVEARYDRWSLITDIATTTLAFSQTTPGTNFSGLDADIRTTVLNAYALYRTYEDSGMSLDLGAGLRWFETDTTLTLLPGALAGRSAQVDNSWTDPVVAARFSYQLSDQWTVVSFLDYGGFRSNSTSWQALITAQYAITDSWSLVGGYRYLDIDHDTGTQNFSFSQSGPVFGATYRF
ncbi:outer membrane beta-barrel protein [Roseobacter ponti]|uniref:Outer membrane beta-barrel protein n=2 Tax=Roseobacter ponti TaxID=1891787 RepID=A0A858SZ01_9RHOB|nr:outer membrane beta-barrel protein [Roseobacter ponti]